MAYTDLIKVERPLGTALNPIASLNAKASAGETVEIHVYIKNQYSSAIGVMPKAVINGTVEAVFTVPYSDIPASYTYYFTGHFTMPNANAEIRAESYYYGVDGQWHFEDHQVRTINLDAAAMKRLQINRDPTAGGVVTTSPDPSTGTVYDGYYPEGTTVYVTANPNSGYRFLNWTGELTDTTNPTAPVYMTENRIITARFESTQVETKRLQINRDPVAGGTVTVSPQPTSGTVYDGHYPEGTTVIVTAHPNSGYVFGSWSGELTDTPNLSAPVYMTENRTVTAHFEVISAGNLSIPILEVAGGTYAQGDSVAFSLKYNYKGPTQQGNLTIYFGVGTFFTVRHTNEAVRVDFLESADWVTRTMTGSFLVPSDLAEDTYSIRVKLELDDGDSVTDTNWDRVTVTPGGDVPPLPPGGYAGTIESLSILLGKGGLLNITLTPYSPPIPDVVVGNQFQLNVFAKNTSDGAERLGLHYVITKPDGSTIDNTVLEAWPYTGAGKEHEFIEPGVSRLDVDQEGPWTLVVELIVDGADNVLDTMTTDLFTDVQEAPPSTFEGIGSMISMMIVMMMLMMMMEQTRDIYEPAGTPPRPKPVTEGVVRGVKGVAKYAGKGIKKVTEYYRKE